MKNNLRLKEIKLAMYLNSIDVDTRNKDYNLVVGVLCCVARAHSNEMFLEFSKFMLESIDDGLVGASSKELIACCSTYFSNRKAAKLLRMSTYKYTSKYTVYLNRDFMTAEFIESLQPKYPDEKTTRMVDYMLNFIENFKLPQSMEPIKELDRERTLELDFYVVYERLLEIFTNDGVVSNIFKELSMKYTLNYSSLSNLRNNIHCITREFPYKIRYSSVHLKREIFTLYTARGYSKGAIGTDVFRKGSKYLYSTGSSLVAEDLLATGKDWCYFKTFDWRETDPATVFKLINILHDFFKCYDY